MADNTAIDVAYVQSCSLVINVSGNETKITCARHLALVMQNSPQKLSHTVQATVKVPAALRVLPCLI